MKAIKQTSLTIGSMEVPVNEIDEPIVIENMTQSSMEEVEIGVAANDDEAESTRLQILPTKVAPFGFDQDATALAPTRS
jgi:hypothetical protein